MRASLDKMTCYHQTAEEGEREQQVQVFGYRSVTLQIPIKTLLSFRYRTYQPQAKLDPRQNTSLKPENELSR